jgi:hypothetical protein
MKRYIGICAATVVLALVAATLATFVSVAQAHPGSWYWGRAATEQYLVNRSSTSDGEDVVETSCRGIGVYWHPRGSAVLWHHLKCTENDDLDRELVVIVHPTSRYHAKVIEVSCDASYSEYTCP